MPASSVTASRVNVGPPRCPERKKRRSTPGTGCSSGPTAVTTRRAVPAEAISIRTRSPADRVPCRTGERPSAVATRVTMRPGRRRSAKVPSRALCVRAISCFSRIAVAREQVGVAPREMPCDERRPGDGATLGIHDRAVQVARAVHGGEVDGIGQRSRRFRRAQARGFGGGLLGGDREAGAVLAVTLQQGTAGVGAGALVPCEPSLPSPATRAGHRLPGPAATPAPRRSSLSLASSGAPPVRAHHIGAARVRRCPRG